MMQVLLAIFRHPDLSRLLTFKGGTSLMLFHGLTRFSTDLDFNLLDASKTEFAYQNLHNLLIMFGTIDDKAMKFYGPILVLNYGKGERMLKVEVSNREYPNQNDAQYTFYKDHATALLDGRMPVFQPDDIVLFGSFFAVNPAIRPVVGGLLRQARQAGAFLYYDINFRKAHIPDIPDVLPYIEENMRLADLVRGSKEDFEYLYGLHDAGDVYGKVRRFCSRFILTDGPHAVHVCTPAGCETFPVRTIKTVSTVGAGDNFNAGYIYAMLQGIDSLSDRIAMAQRWSQDVCRRLGNNISDALVHQLLAVSF